MIAKIAGAIASVANVASEVKRGLEGLPAGETTMVSNNSRRFCKGPFPTGLRYLYLRSKDNQNQVTTIGYLYESPELVKYQVARCHNQKVRKGSDFDKWVKKQKSKSLFVVQDVFNKEIGRQIVEGRLRSKEPLYLDVKGKEDMYNKFIFAYHPDRTERRKAKATLMNQIYINHSNED